MSRLIIVTENEAQKTVEGLYRDLERRIQASQPGLCPVDLAEAFLHICHAQSCGKCTPCRVGLGQLENLMESVLDGSADMETLKTIEKTADAIYHSADCAIGFEAAKKVFMTIMPSMFSMEDVLQNRVSLFPAFLFVLPMWMFRDIFL